MRATSLLLIPCLTCTATLAGCGLMGGSRSSTDNPLVMSRLIDGRASAVIEQIPEEIRLPMPEAPDADYVVGPFDRINVYVYLPDADGVRATMMGSPSSSSRVDGSGVDGAGCIQLPMLGRLAIAGQTLGQLREGLTARYQEHYPMAQVVVELAGTRSQPVYMIGEFGQPGVMYLDRPTTVLQAVAQAHGMTPTADLRMARVLRDGQLLPVDLRRLLDEGDMSQNIWLNAGDTIYIPHNLNQLVFVMGGVNRPGPVAMHDGQLNLLEALSQAGGMPNTETNWREVRIIRTHSATRGEFITVDAVRLLEGEALPVMLESGDVVFVPTAPIGDWNDVIREIQPTFQLIGSFANPFILLRSVSR